MHWVYIGLSGACCVASFLLVYMWWGWRKEQDRRLQRLEGRVHRLVSAVVLIRSYTVGGGREPGHEAPHMLGEFCAQGGCKSVFHGDEDGSLS